MKDFYSVIMTDPKIGHHFERLDLGLHLPLIADFWEKVLLGSPVYFGNPLFVHKKLHERSPLEPEHFARWVEVFCEKVDANFAGERADFAKVRAGQIAQSLHFRLSSDDNSPFTPIAR